MDLNINLLQRQMVRNSLVQFITTYNSVHYRDCQHCSRNIKQTSTEPSCWSHALWAVSPKRAAISKTMQICMFTVSKGTANRQHLVLNLNYNTTSYWSSGLMQHLLTIHRSQTKAASKAAWQPAERSSRVRAGCSHIEMAYAYLSMDGEKWNPWCEKQ